MTRFRSATNKTLHRRRAPPRMNPTLFVGIVLCTYIGILFSNTSSKVGAPVTQVVEVVDDNNQRTLTADSSMENGIPDFTPATASDSTRKSVMIIAVNPTNIHRISAIWSQLECFAKDYDTIIISCKDGDELMNSALVNLGKELFHTMPEISKKIKYLFQPNELFDTGLWCNALRQEDVLEVGPEGKFVGGKSEFTDFFLINDSIMAVEHSTELRDTLYAKDLDMVSYSFWDEDKEGDMPFWVESYARAFSREGVQAFADKFCFRTRNFSWREDCPDMKVTETLGTKLRLKKCIVRITETEVASLYAPNKVSGIYPGRVPKTMLEPRQFARSYSWTGHYQFWSDILRNIMKIPVVKVSEQSFLNHAMINRPADFATCTMNMDEDVRSVLNQPYMNLGSGAGCSREMNQIGKLWFGEHSSLMTTYILEIVVAYCKQDLDWLHESIIEVVPNVGITDVRVTIMSKCGNEVDIPTLTHKKLVSKVDVISLPNVGGCDYAYAHFINQYASRGALEEAQSSVVLFIKDTPRTEESFHFAFHRGYREIEDMILLASKRGFACGVKTNCNISPYHHTETLHGFTLNRYERISEREGRKVRGNVIDDFNLYGYRNLADFTKRALNWTFPNEVTPVCYGGTFAVSGSQLINRQKQTEEQRVLSKLDGILSRNSTKGSTIEEHFVERVWASLFSPHLTEDETKLLLETSTEFLSRQFSIYGILKAGDSLC